MTTIAKTVKRTKPIVRSRRKEIFTITKVLIPCNHPSKEQPSFASCYTATGPTGKVNRWPLDYVNTPYNDYQEDGSVVYDHKRNMATFLGNTNTYSAPSTSPGFVPSSLKEGGLNLTCPDDFKTDIIHLNWSTFTSDPEMQQHLFMYKFCRFKKMKISIRSMDSHVTPIWHKYNNNTKESQISHVNRVNSELWFNNKLKQNIPFFNFDISNEAYGGVPLIWNDSIFSYHLMFIPDYTHYVGEYCNNDPDGKIALTNGYKKWKNFPYTTDSRTQLAIIEDPYDVYDAYTGNKSDVDGYIDYDFTRFDSKTSTSKYSKTIHYTYAPNTWFKCSDVLVKGAAGDKVRHADLIDGVYPDPKFVIKSDDYSMFRMYDPRGNLEATPPELSLSSDEFEKATTMKPLYPSDAVKREYRAKPWWNFTNRLGGSFSVQCFSMQYTSYVSNSRTEFEDFLISQQAHYYPFEHRYEIDIEYEMEFFCPLPSYATSEAPVPVPPPGNFNPPPNPFGGPVELPVAQPSSIWHTLTNWARIAALHVAIQAYLNRGTKSYEGYNKVEFRQVVLEEDEYDVV